jgi:hypothetical protein
MLKHAAEADGLAAAADTANIVKLDSVIGDGSRKLP